MNEKLQLKERRKQARKLSDSIHSLRTAYRYALETDDTSMVEEIDDYAVRRLGLSALEVDYVYLTAEVKESHG